MTRVWFAAGVVAGLLGVVGCDEARSPVGPSVVVLAADVQAALDLTIQDEYRAETIYQGVLNDFGPVLPFAAILTAEQRHSTVLGQLFSKRGLPVPVSAVTVAAVPHFVALREACAAGVTAERENIALYDRFLAGDLPDDVRQVFSNNRRASVENHLPAFITCA
ncbi:MAG: DUF2202 domain-containing protein [Acidobacteria bacterium]|nr:DUF2202 domain-containing protein [Acidobacteriota bacterium]